MRPIYGLSVCSGNCMDTAEDGDMTYVCSVCGWVYDPEIGDPEGGIEPGTAFEDLPDDWACPECGAGKADFEAAE